MRSRISTVMIIGVLAALMTLGTTAGASEKVEVPEFFSFPDQGSELAVFINISRDEVCTDDQVAFEEAIIDWLEGGMVGPPPDEPATSPEGRELVTLQFNAVKSGALIGQISEKDLYIELWELDSLDNRPFVGPCTDTDDDGGLFATGTSTYRANDNDFFGSGSRGNSFGDRGRADVEDADGNEYVYSWMFHLNSNCYAPGDGPPACLRDVGSLVER